MILIYFITALVIAVGIYLSTSRVLRSLLFGGFLVIQLVLTGYSFSHLGQFDALYFQYDSLGVLFLALLTLLSIAVFYHSLLYTRRHQTLVRHESLYFAFLVLLIASMSGAYFADHLGVLWALIEATTLSVAVLIYHERTPRAVEATWKYIFLCSVGITIAFAGILFLAAEVSNAGIETLSFSAMLPKAAQFDDRWMKITFLLVLTGFSVKMGLFPFHTASLDAQTTAPQPINALLSTVLKNVGFLAVFRIYAIIQLTPAAEWARHVLLLVGIISLALAAIQMSRAFYLPRLFGYSGVEHMGLAALGLAAGGIGVYAAILHLVLHALAKASLFFQNDQIHNHFLGFRVNRIGNYLKLNPAGGVVVILGFMSISGVPPSGLFISELLIFKSLFIGGNLFIGILALILLTLILYYFSQRMLHLLFDVSDEEMVLTEVGPNRMETVSQFALMGLMIYLAFFPPAVFTNLLHQAAP